jgi:hypothetical protein
MRFVPPHDQTLAAAFKAAAITFLTAWLIPGKRVCKAGTSQGEAPSGWCRIREKLQRLGADKPYPAILLGADNDRRPAHAATPRDAVERQVAMDEVVLGARPVGKRGYGLIGICEASILPSPLVEEGSSTPDASFGASSLSLTGRVASPDLLAGIAGWGGGSCIDPPTLRASRADLPARGR